jgi:hypothetical protein
MKRRSFLAASAAAVTPFSLTGRTEESSRAIAPNIDLWTHHRRDRNYLASSGRSTGPQSWDDLRLVARLLAVYKRTFSLEHYGEGMWRQFFEKRHGSLHKIFMSGDIVAAATVLRNPAASDLHYGFENTVPEFTEKLVNSVQRAEDYAVLCKMHLVTLAEALGLIILENPETYSYKPNSPAGPEIDTLLTQLDRAFGTEIAFPNPFPNEFGLKTPRGIAGYRAVHALYQAYRIRALQPRSVVEIGGGLGRTAYYCHLLGKRDYVMVDLPFTALSQGYFLGTLLGERALVLDGEPYRRDAIKIESPDTFLKSKRNHDLFVNVDSLTEIPLAVATPYYQAFRRRGKLLLSINHEANAHTVHADLGDVKHTRFPYWMRRGYVEELYSLE